MMQRFRTGRQAALARLAVIAQYDFCPWSHRYVAWLKQPIGWIVAGAGASLLIAVCLEPQAWIIFGSLIAVMGMGVVWPWLAIYGTRAEMAFDCRRSREGESVQVRLRIENRWPWPLWGMAVEKGFSRGADAPPGEDSSAADPAQWVSAPTAALARVAGWSCSEFVFEFRPSQRGVYPHRVPELATGFPFGLWRASRQIAVERELLVWPHITPLHAMPALGGDVADVVGMLFDRPGEEGDMIGVRPFRQGDRLRSIHWGQTARRDALMVTERQAAARRLIVILVDTAAFAAQSSALETAIRAAASVAQAFHAHHAQVRFLIGDVDLLLEPRTAGWHRLLDALACFPTDGAVDKLTGSDAARRMTEVLCRDAFTLLATSTERAADWDRGAGSCGRLRFLLVGSRAAAECDERTQSVATARRREWIVLDSNAECSAPLRRQWERVCHDSITN
ncbi:DUF58 domain-containing protein [Lignipirellula cremea]|uniref:DUF58 domain-containing protein n=1 Tax=Lignipirellula cremea TaxID=2528010 RepID=A0A518E432_9BACT|nr:DUF58 domain-containing protein [Lignipirellula cremea]QDU98850.1 hypothetical protein Pla8534_67610 [Lignipirellula cremea]